MNKRSRKKNNRIRTPQTFSFIYFLHAPFTKLMQNLIDPLTHSNQASQLMMLSMGL